MAAKGTVTVGPLDTVARVRRELARVYRDTRRGELDPGDASRFANMLSILGRLIEGSDVEQRLARLEAIENNEPWKRPR